MHCLIVTQYFYPELGVAVAKRAYRLAKALRQAGHQVSVVTGFPNHPAGRLFPGYRNGRFQREQIDGMEVVRAPLFISPSKRFWPRTLNYLSFFFSGTLAALRRPRADLVICFCGPLPLAVSGMMLAARHRCRFVLDISDVWPESAVGVGMVHNPALIRLVDAMGRLSYRRAALITLVSPGFVEMLRQKGVSTSKLAVLTDFVDVERFQSISSEREAIRYQLDLDGAFTVMYVGNIGAAQGLEVVPQAAIALSQEPGISFVLVGEGPERDRLRRQCDRLGLTNVQFVPRQPAELVPRFLAASDALLVSLSPNPIFRHWIPSKLYESMASGRPVLACLDGVARSVVEKAGCGITLAPGDSQGLARSIRELAACREQATQMGRRGREYACARASQESVCRNFVEVVVRAANGSSRGHKPIRLEEWRPSVPAGSGLGDAR